MKTSRGTLVWLWLAVGLMAAAPFALYWQFVSRWPSVSSTEARRLVQRLDSPAMLVDVRPQSEFDSGHILGAENWPTGEIESLSPGDPVLKRFANRRVLVMSESGIADARAVRKFLALSIDAESVRGGMESWMSAARKPCAVALSKGGSEADMSTFYFRPMPALSQWAAAAAAFVIKPVYMIVALLVIIALRRKASPDLRALRWAVACFLAGEVFCGSNYLIFDNDSLLFDHLHNTLMPIAFGLATYAILDSLDRRMIRYGDSGASCAAAGLCGSCAKSGGERCGLERLFLAIIPATIVLAFIPLAARLHMVSYNTGIFGVVYSYNHPVAHQVFEFRYLPAAAICFLTVSLLILAAKGRPGVPASRAFFAAGAGAFGFSLMRLAFLTMFQDDLAWASVWEEVTELLFAGGAAYALWIFRRGLGQGASPRPTASD